MNMEMHKIESAEEDTQEQIAYGKLYTDFADKINIIGLSSNEEDIANLKKDINESEKLNESDKKSFLTLLNHLVETNNHS